MEDIFEGDNLDQNKTISEDLDLFTISTECKHLWKLAKRSAKHTAMVILLEKGLNPVARSSLQQKISASLGQKDFSLGFNFSDKKLTEWGVSHEKISGLKKIIAMEEVTASNLCKVKEGGIYLVKGFKVLYETDDDIFWGESYDVRRKMGILYGKTKIMSENEARNVAKNWTGYRSQISYFLSRLKDEGAIKILTDTSLTVEDFYNSNDI